MLRLSWPRKRRMCPKKFFRPIWKISSVWRWVSIEPTFSGSCHYLSSKWPEDFSDWARRVGKSLFSCRLQTHDRDKTFVMAIGPIKIESIESVHTIFWLTAQFVVWWNNIQRTNYCYGWILRPFQFSVSSFQKIYERGVKSWNSETTEGVRSVKTDQI
jgi:hypothetical protein